MKHEAVLPVQSWSVATADNGMLVLIVDRGLDTELLLSVTPEVAKLWDAHWARKAPDNLDAELLAAVGDQPAATRALSGSG